MQVRIICWVPAGLFMHVHMHMHMHMHIHMHIHTCRCASSAGSPRGSSCMCICICICICTYICIYIHAGAHHLLGPRGALRRPRAARPQPCGRQGDQSPDEFRAPLLPRHRHPSTDDPLHADQQAGAYTHTHTYIYIHIHTYTYIYIHIHTCGACACTYTPINKQLFSIFICKKEQCARGEWYPKSAHSWTDAFLNTASFR